MPSARAAAPGVQPGYTGRSTARCGGASLRTLPRMTTRKPERSISLDPMTEEEFAAWLLPTVRDIADQHVRSGRWAEQDALEFAKTEIRTALPNGLHSDEQHLYTIRDAAGGAGIGVLWIGMRRRARKSEVYIHDVAIDEAQRGKGYGRAAMTAAVRRAGELGAATVSLHVFGHNTTARALYASLGFVETNVNMTLSLEDDGAA
jgi:ribosomal protein S18 acetylase RimI-like enzyme